MNPARAHDPRVALHAHAFGDEGSLGRERAMGRVALLTLATMAVELIAGWWSGSLALTADGWHMGTHAAAIGGAWLAYRLAARAGAGYAFGGWKIEVLAAYTSGIGLLAVAAAIAIEGYAGLWNPRTVAYGPALLVAVIGLAVNIASAWMLTRALRGAPGPVAAQGHDHGHDHGHARRHGPASGHAHDVNFSAAYLHVLADALTSLLAIAALAGGAWLGWTWLDPLVALVGAAVIAQWAFGVLRSTARSLVDATADPALAQRIRQAIECDGDAAVTDLHVWQVGARAWSAALAVVADAPRPAEEYRARLHSVAPLRHVTIEVHRCPGCTDATPAVAQATSREAPRP